MLHHPIIDADPTASAFDPFPAGERSELDWHLADAHAEWAACEAAYARLEHFTRYLPVIIGTLVAVLVIAPVIVAIWTRNPA